MQELSLFAQIRRNSFLTETWRPALTFTGADGFPPISNAGNVMRPQSALKLSMRLPPLVNPRQQLCY